MSTDRIIPGKRLSDIFHYFLLIALMAMLITGCRGPEADVLGEENGQVTPVGAVQAIVTRIVNQFSTDGAAVIATAVPAIKDPVILDISLRGSLPDLDPAAAIQNTQLDLIQNLFVGLTNFNPATNTIDPELATEWSVGPDGRTWTFRLRDDINWVKPRSSTLTSSELRSVEIIRPVVAEDVVFAVQRFCARDVESRLTFTLFLIEGCEALYQNPERTETDRAALAINALDATTLEIRLTEPAGYFLSLTSMPFFQPVPRELVDELGDEWLTNSGFPGDGWQTVENLITSGPFILLPEPTTEGNVVLQPNPFWPIPKTGNVEIINIFFINDDLDAFELWQDRLLDIAPLPSSEREAFLQRTPDKARLIPEPVLFYLGFDFGSSLFSEPEIRRAFSAAINREELIIEIYGGRGIPMRHATVPGIVAGLTADEIGIGYSPDFARLQMAASSFKDCRLMPPITIMVSSADLSMLQAELIREMWVEELRCEKNNIVIEQVSFGELLANTRPDSVQRPDMWELAWAPSFPDAHNYLNDLLHCNDSENRQNRPCGEVDTQQQRGSTTFDTAERSAIYREVENIFFGENGLYPIAPLYIRSQFVVIQDWVTTFQPVTFGGQQWDTIVLDPVLKDLDRSRTR